MTTTNKKGFGELGVTTIPTLTDIPRGHGSSMICDYETKMTRVCEGAGPIVAAVWNRDDSLLVLLKPTTDLPEKYNIQILKLANSGMKDFYPKPDAVTEKMVLNQWQTYAIMIAKREVAEIRIYNAIIRTIADDLLALVEGNTTLSKKDGPALFDFLKTSLLG